MAETTERIIIDCDPGHDDMAAILLAAFHDSISLEAITTVCGNASLANTTNNALRIVEAFDLAVPVYAGAVQPFGVEHRWAAGHFTGEDVAAGIGGAAYRFLGRAGAGELGRVGQVYCHLKYLGFRLEHRGQTVNQALGCKTSPALAQV